MSFAAIDPRRTQAVQRGRRPPLCSIVGWPRLGLDDPHQPLRRPGNIHSTALQAAPRGSLLTQQSPKSAAAHFVLAYQYLTAEHADAAVRQLKIVTALQPKDTLSAQLIQQLEHPQQQAGSANRRCCPAGDRRAPLRRPGQAADTAPAGKEGKIEGTWTAQPNNDMKITIALQSDKGRISAGKSTVKARTSSSLENPATRTVS